MAVTTKAGAKDTVGTGTYPKPPCTRRDSGTTAVKSGFLVVRRRRNGGDRSRARRPSSQPWIRPAHRALQRQLGTQGDRSTAVDHYHVDAQRERRMRTRRCTATTVTARRLPRQGDHERTSRSSPPTEQRPEMHREGRCDHRVGEHSQAYHRLGQCLQGTSVLARFTSSGLNVGHQRGRRHQQREGDQRRRPEQRHPRLLDQLAPRVNKFGMHSASGAIGLDTQPPRRSPTTGQQAGKNRLVANQGEPQRRRRCTLEMPGGACWT